MCGESDVGDVGDVGYGGVLLVIFGDGDAC